MSELAENTSVCVKDGPMVSVILPVYNIPDSMLNRCVESITSQTYSNVEIILVDDGSTLQECRTGLDELARTDSRIKVIHKPNGGVSSARNCGIEQAKGEFIFFVDPDDELEDKTVVKTAVDHAVRNQADIVFATVAFCFEDKSFSTPLWGAGFDGGARTYDASKAAVFRDYFFSCKKPKAIGNIKYFMRGPIAKLFRRETIGDVRFNEGLTYSEDTVFNACVFARAARIVAVNSSWYRYYQYTKSAVHSDSNNMLVKVEENCEAAKASAAQVSENVYLSFCDNIIQWGACEILRNGGFSSVKQATSLLGSAYSRGVYSCLDLSEFELGGTDMALQAFLKDGHYVLYCLAIKLGLLLMPLRGKKLIG